MAHTFRLDASLHACCPKNFKPHLMTFHSDDAGEIVFPVSLGGKVFAALPRGTACSMLSSCNHDIEKI